jgi:hypothetical protein
MQHSTWDLEVHAREMQRRRFREAERARQIEAARRGSDRTRMQGTRFSFSRLITAFRQCFSPRPIPAGAVRAPALVEAELRPLAVEASQVMPKGRSGELSQPYAGMMVLARGTSAPTPPQPCAAGDC